MEDEKDARTITKDELEELSRRDVEDLETRASEALEAMDKAERHKLETAIQEACLEYTGKVDEAIREAGEELSESIAALRQKFGTMIVDAAIYDKPALDNLALLEEPAESIAEAEENHPAVGMTP